LKIEKVQERTLRFVYEDYNSSYDNLLKKAKVPSLQIRRMRTMALEIFKIMKRAKTVAEYLSSACRTATFSIIPGLH
jgi:3-oxoacyl-(acyl-carrier-protein) synthase